MATYLLDPGFTENKVYLQTPNGSADQGPVGEIASDSHWTVRTFGLDPRGGGGVLNTTIDNEGNPSDGIWQTENDEATGRFSILDGVQTAEFFLDCRDPGQYLCKEVELGLLMLPQDSTIPLNTIPTLTQADSIEIGWTQKVVTHAENAYRRCGRTGNFSQTYAEIHFRNETADQTIYYRLMTFDSRGSVTVGYWTQSDAILGPLVVEDNIGYYALPLLVSGGSAVAYSVDIWLRIRALITESTVAGLDKELGHWQFNGAFWGQHTVGQAQLTSQVSLMDVQGITVTPPEPPPPFVPYTPDTSLIVEPFNPALNANGDQLLLDTRLDMPYMYLASTSVYPSPASNLYVVDRHLNALVDTTALFAQFATKFSAPDMDLGGNLYFAPPGGITWTFQLVGQFDADGRILSQTANKDGFPATGYDPGDGLLYTGSGAFRPDNIGSSGLLCVWDQVNATNVRIRGIDNATMTLQWVISLVDDLGYSGARIADVAWDDSGNMWVLIYIASGTRHVYLYQISTTGVPTLEAELTSTFPNVISTDPGKAMSLRWLPDENALLISSAEKFAKYDLDDHAVTDTVLIATLAPTGHFSNFWITSKASMHGPFEGSALWFGYSYIGPYSAPDHTTIPTRMVVRGIRFDTATMTVTDTPEWYIPRAYFPLAAGNQFVDLTAVVFDVQEYALWGGLTGVPRSIVKLLFVKEETPPTPPPTVVPPDHGLFLLENVDNLPEAT